MKPGKAELGTKNCGANVEGIRKSRGMKQTTLITRMQLLGVDIDPYGLSKLEGQTRLASDAERKAILTKKETAFQLSLWCARRDLNPHVRSEH